MKLCLITWIALTASAVFPSLIRADDALQIEPSQVALDGAYARCQLLVRTAGGIDQPDLTHQAIYRSSRPDVAGVGPTGQVVAYGDGQADITISVNGAVRSIPVRVSGVGELGGRPVVRFQEHILPIMSKAGCNAGACHASQYGQGDFKLSVFASDAKADYQAMVRAALGRRVSFVEPAKSLVLLKATGSIVHGGGTRLDRASVDYQMFQAWIAAGAPAPGGKDVPKVTGLKVVPARRIGSDTFSQQLRVLAAYSDGIERDVTHWARYDSMDEGVLQVSQQGLVQTQGRGQGTAMARFEGHTAIMQVVVPFGPPTDLSGWKENNFIDKFAAAKFHELGLAPAPLCDDAVFLRRAYIDAIGSTPTVEQARAFLDSKDPDKRVKLVGQLLGLTGDPTQDIHNNSYAAWWGLQWADLLRNRGGARGVQEMWVLHNWLQASFRDNKRFDVFVRELITARGSLVSNGPANFYRIFKTSDERTEAVAQVFLGVRLQCAQCHHHPFEAISQADYYRMAAFFARVGTKSLQDFGIRHATGEIIVGKTGEVKHPKTNEVMTPTPLHGRAIVETPSSDRRQGLAEWITTADNPYFARNVVNRYWAHCMGRGLVEPVDDLRGTNPATNPELLDALAAEFTRTGYDVKQLLRTIMTSRLYNLDSGSSLSADVDGRFYTSFKAKRIPAEPLSDAIDDATGAVPRFKGVPTGARAIELPDSIYDDGLLTTFGKPQRESVCECERIAEPSLAQALHTLNNERIQAKLSDPKGRIARLVNAKIVHDKAVEELYLAALARRPTPIEQDACRRLAAEAPDAKSFYEDLLWSLLNSKHFLIVR